MGRQRRTAALLLAAFLLLSGCSFQIADELYMLPQQTEQYNNLQAELDELLSSGAEYSAPVSGDNQQSIQMVDLTGDGVDEVIAFLKTGGSKPLKVYIYELNTDRYELLHVLERDGSAFDRVDYAQVDGIDGSEIIVGTQVSNQVLQAVSVYSVDQKGAAELMSTNYLKYTVADLNGDACSDVLTFRSGEEEGRGVAELYCYRDGTMHSLGTAAMTMPMTPVNITRITSGFTQENVRAVFVASSNEQTGLITDVFAIRSSAFANIALSDDPVNSTPASRNGEIYATDIDGDGLMELPSTMQLPNLNGEQTETYALINWYNLTLDGRKLVKLTTYYNNTDGWYLIIPGQWQGNLIVNYEQDENGEMCYSFYQYSKRPEQAVRVVSVYVFSGTDAQKLASEDGRFLLARKGDIIYAASLTEEGGMQRSELTALFQLIQTQWNYGQMREEEKP